jgi:transposase-like protein
MGERAAPFYCPYCGEEDIRPEGEGHGDWRCSSCARLWRLRYLGLSRTALGGTLRPQPAESPEV